jgi:hypothetical protein
MFLVLDGDKGYNVFFNEEELVITIAFGWDACNFRNETLEQVTRFLAHFRMLVIGDWTHGVKGTEANMKKGPMTLDQAMLPAAIDEITIIIEQLLEWFPELHDDLVVDNPAFSMRDGPPQRLFTLTNVRKLLDGGASPNLVMYILENALYRLIWIDDQIPFRGRLWFCDLLINYHMMRLWHVRNVPAAAHVGQRRSASNVVVVELPNNSRSALSRCSTFAWLSCSISRSARQVSHPPPAEWAIGWIRQRSYGDHTDQRAVEGTARLVLVDENESMLALERVHRTRETVCGCDVKKSDDMSAVPDFDALRGAQALFTFVRMGPLHGYWEPVDLGEVWEVIFGQERMPAVRLVAHTGMRDFRSQSCG